MIETIKTKLHTRKEIIEIWQGQKDEFLNLYCCPSCRNLLYGYPYPTSLEVYYDHYYCHNQDCANYNFPIENIS